MCYKLSFVILFFNLGQIHAQDSLDIQKWENSIMQNSAGITGGTFKATQIVNMPTVESPAGNTLQFMIMHRFGRINEGGYALFGLDNATIRFALDYGINDRVSIGIGRSSFDKVYDGSLKWKIMRQKVSKFPLTASLYSMIAYTTQRYPEKSYYKGKLRASYTSQLILARKFTENLSVQLVPTWIHLNLVPTPADNNDLTAIGAGGRLKLSKRISLNAEYNLVPDHQIDSQSITNSLSFGIDIETGGHVFQLIFSNSQGMAGPYYLTRTTGEWEKGDIYFGFNITRLFDLKR